MKRLLIALAALVFAGQAQAADNYTATQGSGTTFGAKDVGAGLLFPYSIPSDVTGAALFSSANPGRVNGVQDNTAFTYGTTPFLVMGGVYNSSITNCTSGDQCAVALTISRAMHVNVDNTNANGQATMANSSPVTIASDQSAVAVNAQPTTSGGLSNYFVQPTASDNHVVIKAGAGQVYKISITNNSATVNYVRLYNATTGFNGCNSATNLVYANAIPANTSVGGISDSWEAGIAFSTGISICVTSGYATNDTTNATATAMNVNIGYK